MTEFLLRRALVGDEVRADVGIAVRDGVISRVGAAVEAPDIVLEGVTVPGFANAHSHAFHRALRGRTHVGGSFWTWRQLMYSVAGRLEPELYRRLAVGVFAEMLESGYTAVGEFHYVHHRADGTPYPNPQAITEALVSAAEESGIRLTLLDTLYLHGGLSDDGYLPLAAGQLRFGDGSATDFWQRAGSIPRGGLVQPGIAVHSVRAVDPAAMTVLAALVGDRPVHVHVSEQPDENDQSARAHGRTPTEVLGEAGLLGPRTTAVHATHLTAVDVGLLAESGTTVCLCPTTERDLGDGLGMASELLAAGVALCIGSDSHAVIDPFAELAAIEMNERLRTGRRGIVEPATLLGAGAPAGYRSLGWAAGGRIAVGSPADLVAIADTSRRTAGALGGNQSSDTVIGGLIHATSAADVTDVIVAGRRVVAGGRHVRVDTARCLAGTIEELTA